MLNTIPDDRLRVYVVWGPMLGEEKAEDAPEASVHILDPRVTQYWTPAHTLAQALAVPAGLPAGEKAWDTFQLYTGDARWEETPPTPAYVMHVGKSLPQERRLNGETLAQKVRELLAAR